MHKRQPRFVRRRKRHGGGSSGHAFDAYFVCWAILENLKHIEATSRPSSHTLEEFQRSVQRALHENTGSTGPDGSDVRMFVQGEGGGSRTESMGPKDLLAKVPYGQNVMLGHFFAVLLDRNVTCTAEDVRYRLGDGTTRTADGACPTIIPRSPHRVSSRTVPSGTRAVPSGGAALCASASAIQRMDHEHATRNSSGMILSGSDTRYFCFCVS